jgi:hypothetical protein
MPPVLFEVFVLIVHVASQCAVGWDIEKIKLLPPGWPMLRIDPLLEPRPEQIARSRA